MKTSVDHLIKQSGLRDTQQRRAVAAAVDALQCATPREIELWLGKNGYSVNTVTVYRVLEAFEAARLIHRHHDGRVSLCSMPDTHGHHALLHCTDCDAITEFHDERICDSVGAHAKSSGFRVAAHVTEILGVCSHCK